MLEKLRHYPLLAATSVVAAVDCSSCTAAMAAAVDSGAAASTMDGYSLYAISRYNRAPESCDTVVC